MYQLQNLGWCDRLVLTDPALHQHSAHLYLEAGAIIAN